MFFHYRGLEYVSRKSRNTWSNTQIWAWSIEWSRAEANRVLPREQTGHGKHPFPTTQEKTLNMDITRRPTPKSDWLYPLQPKTETLYRVSRNKTGSWLWLTSWTPITKFRLILKKVGETTRPFRYDLNQNTYDYTAELRNRFKGLDLIDRVPDELMTEVHDTIHRRQESRPSPRKRKAKSKNGCLRRPYK